MAKNKLRNIIISTAIFSTIVSSAFASQIKHKVVTGDTIYGIAKKYNVPVKSLLEANGLEETSVIKIDQNILIPSENVTPDRSGSVSNARRFSLTQVHTNTANVCLRSEPSTSSERIMLLGDNTNCTLLERTNDKWAKVKVNGKEGFIYRELLAPGAYTQKEAVSDRRESLLSTAVACRGSRYMRGGSGRAGFDCSGFTKYVFAQHGINLPRTSASQSQVGNFVSKSELMPGDLVFFSTRGAGVSHVGIYIGNGNMIHAASTRSGVKIDSISSDYYAKRYHSARRVK